MPAKKKQAKKGKVKAGQKAKSKAAKTHLASLWKKVKEAQKDLAKATNEANALRMQAKGVEGAARKVYADAIIPYRAACRKAGVKCKSTGVRFALEKVKGGVKVMIRGKGKPETVGVVPDKIMEEEGLHKAVQYAEKLIRSSLQHAAT